MSEQKRRKRATLEAAIRFAEVTAKVAKDPKRRAAAAARAVELRAQS